MKVYVLLEDNDVIGVYSSQTKAAAEQRKLIDVFSNEIEEYELDAKIDQRVF